MKLNSKVTWGLAWTGLAVVLAVPSVDFLTGRLGSKDAAAVLTSDIEPRSARRHRACRQGGEQRQAAARLHLRRNQSEDDRDASRFDRSDSADAVPVMGASESRT